MSKPAAGYMVYMLIDPRDRLPFYVGATCRPYARWHHHISEHMNAGPIRLQEIRALGLKCRVRILADNLGRAEAFALERETILAHRATLLNGQGWSYRERQKAAAA